MNWERVRVGAELGYDPYAELEERIRAEGIATLDTETPGGAAVAVWAESGFSTDESTATSMLEAALGKAKSQAGQYASRGGEIVGTSATAFCAATPAAPAAPVCGLVGTVIGATLGALGSLYESVAGVNKARARSDLYEAVFDVQELVLDVQCAIARTWFSLYDTKLDYEDSAFLIKAALYELGYDDDAKNLRQLVGLEDIYDVNQYWHIRCPEVATSTYVEGLINEQQKQAGGDRQSVQRYIDALPMNMWVYYPTFALESGAIVADAENIKDLKDWCDQKRICESRLRGVYDAAQRYLEAAALVTAAFINMADDHADEPRRGGTGILDAQAERRRKAREKAARKKSSSGGATIAVVAVAGLGLGALLLKGLHR